MKKVVFVGGETSSRNQIAEAFARIHGGGNSKPSVPVLDLQANQQCPRE